jgi:hypothetical protein
MAPLHSSKYLPSGGTQQEVHHRHIVSSCGISDATTRLVVTVNQEGHHRHHMLGSSDACYTAAVAARAAAGVVVLALAAIWHLAKYVDVLGESRTEYSRLASGQARSTPVCLHTVALAIRPRRIPAYRVHSRPAALEDHRCVPTNAAAGSMVSQGQVAASALTGQPCFVCKLAACVLWHSSWAASQCLLR